MLEIDVVDNGGTCLTWKYLLFVYRQVALVHAGDGSQPSLSITIFFHLNCATQGVTIRHTILHGKCEIHKMDLFENTGKHKRACGLV
jgi:hypothetical protein